MLVQRDGRELKPRRVGGARLPLPRPTENSRSPLGRLRASAGGLVPVPANDTYFVFFPSQQIDTPEDVEKPALFPGVD